LKVVKAEQQLVSGFNYRVTLEDAAGATYIVVIYVSLPLFTAELKVTSITKNGIDISKESGFATLTAPKIPTKTIPKNDSQFLIAYNYFSRITSESS
jgi:hypothetical protein